MFTEVPSLAPSAKPYLAAMLLASVVNCELLADPPRYKVPARFAAAVAAAASAALCMSRLVKYHIAASVPRPAKPSMPVSARPITITVAPERSPSATVIVIGLALTGMLGFAGLGTEAAMRSEEHTSEL